MKLAWKEIKFNKKKYALIEGILILMVFMVLFLSGLANGLARAVSAVIENEDAPYYVVTSDAEQLITISKLSDDVVEEIRELTEDEVAPFNLQRMNLNVVGDSTKLDVAYFAYEIGSFIDPELVEGNALTEANNEIVLDESFAEEGIQIGDELEDSTTGVRFTVVGFAKDAYYGHVGVGYISHETYMQIRKAINPTEESFFHAVAIDGDDIENLQVSGIEVVSKDDIISNIPGYSAEQTTIQMILWVLVIISAAILGVFFYVITIQKEKQFGVLKAIGMPMRKITAMILSQVLLLACFSVVVGNVLTIGMAAMLPASMPFYFSNAQAILVSVVFIVVSVLCSLISTAKVASVDPMISIGGNE